MGVRNMLARAMKLIIKVPEVVAAARRFEQSPRDAMRELVSHTRAGFASMLEQVMNAEIELFLGQGAERENKRNGFTSRTYAVKGIGAVRVKVPRDRDGRFNSNVVPPRRRYDEDLARDIALLDLAGLSTRMVSHLSQRVLGMPVSPTEVSNALHQLVPGAKAFLNRRLDDRRFKYLYVDGTNFRVRRTTVALEPTLVVVGVDEMHRKSVLAAVQGDKEKKSTWAMVFHHLKERGLDASAVQLGVMDGLPGLADAFIEAFPAARVGRCWVHKATNVMPRVPKRYQAQFKLDWNAIQYAEGEAAARCAFGVLQARWSTVCPDAVDAIERDLGALLMHYRFPRDHWEALRTTNPIERVNKEFKRRSKAMEVVSDNGLKVLLAFIALRLEYNWSTKPITNNGHVNLPQVRANRRQHLDAVTSSLVN